MGSSGSLWRRLPPRSCGASTVSATRSARVCTSWRCNPVLMYTRKDKRSPIVSAAAAAVVAALLGLAFVRNVIFIQRQPTHKIVLGWTPMYANPIWWGLTKDEDYVDELRGEDCFFTTNRSYLQSADLVVFHGCFQPHDGFAYPDYRQPWQRWVYVMLEAPTSRYCANQFLPADGLFNITATYKRDSDIVLSYAPGFISRVETTRNSTFRGTTARKTKLAFWYMSDCTSEWSSLRSQYVKELRRHMHVDVFGICNSLVPDIVDPPCPKSSDRSMDQCFLQQSKQYKFYLAFENAHCRDYITEKLFRVLRPESDVVPVALGAPISDYGVVAPPDSFIHASNFSSPKHLAAYLLYLDKNNEAYMAYHRWRERFTMRPVPGQNSIDQHPPSQLRQLCAAAHRPSPPRVWKNLVSWFSIEKNCNVIQDVCQAYGICAEEHQTQQRVGHHRLIEAVVDVDR